MQHRAYQYRAIAFGKDVKTPFFAIDMGLGKTLIALSIIADSDKPSMVIGPLNTILYTWPAEIEKWYPYLTYRVLHGKTRNLEGIDKVDVLLMNYEGLAWFAKQSCQWKKRNIIFDESSMVKSHATQRFRLLKQMPKLWTQTKMCLSATPAPNSMHDLWSQYYLLDQGKRLGSTISNFRAEYCRSFSFPGRAFTVYEVMEEAKEAIAQATSDITFRLEASDHLDMPERVLNKIECALPAAAYKQYKKLEKDLVLDAQNVSVANAGVLSNKLRQIVQGGIYDDDHHWHILHKVKIKALQELINISNGKSILCAIQFKGELEMLREEFGDIPVIAGGTPRKDVTKFIGQWNNQELSLLCCHPASLAHGLNLQTGGHIIVWYGLTWSLEHYLQFNGRLHRQGQTNTVVIHHLVAKNTVDEVVMDALENKRQVQEYVLDYYKRATNERG